MNKVILVGRLTSDPEVKKIGANETSVCKVGLAVDRKFKKAGEEKKVDFLNLVMWGKTAELAGQYLGKGRRIGVVGRIEINGWTNQEGKNVKNVEVIVDELEFLDSAKDSNNSNYQQVDELPFGN